MSYRCLADFLEELGHAGELVRVEAEVAAVLEAAEITGRIARSGGPALLFRTVADRQIPVLTNLLGTEARIARALGVGSLAEAADRIERLANPAEPEGWFERLKTSPHVAALAKLSPRRVKSGPCQQVVRLGSDIDLSELPMLQSAPGEAGPAITAAVVLTAEAGSQCLVAGRCDLKLLDSDRLAACWAGHEEPARVLAEYARRNERMPLAAVLGGDPALLLAAAALPPQVDVCALAGVLREKPIDLVGGRSVELEVPADAEIVIEGYIDPSEAAVDAGPVCTPVGYYRPIRPTPVVHVTAVTHRTNPIYPAMVPGRPPNEACVVRRAMARVFLPLAKLSIGELVDFDLPMFGAARHWAVLSIRKTYAGQARRVVHAAWGLRQFMLAKVLVVVDQSVDVHDGRAVLSAITAHVDPGRDVTIQRGPPDPLDPAAPPDELGNRMAIDATAKLPGERAGLRSEPAVTSEAIRKLVTDRWAEYGLGPEPE